MAYPLPSRELPSSGSWFAPAARANMKRVRELADYCLHNPVTKAILESVDGFILILNQERQVLAANPETLKALNVQDTECLLGLRPGELFGCAFSSDEPGGCGTSRNCSTCGAVIAILASQELNEPVTRECLMTVVREGKHESHEFQVRSTPINLNNTPLTIFVINDISSAKRREVLENVFIHDLNNILTGLNGWSETLVRRPHDAATIAGKIVNISMQLTQEVQSQRLLVQAERGDLKVTLEPVGVSKILEGLKGFFSGYPAENVDRLQVCDGHGNIFLYSSEPLLIRVLANMVKNAFEATTPPEPVRVWFEMFDGTPCFVVHNTGEIPDTIAMQIFKRSFSSKGSHGRGLGTYSMKLFGEQYLGGEVGFRSSEKEGTTFYIKLPPECAESPPQPCQEAEPVV